MRVSAIVLGALLISVPFCSAAGTLSLVSCLEPKETGCVYDFKGTITSSDVASFTAIKRISEQQHHWIHLDSDGGDVAAAVKIGRHLQEIMATVEVARDRRCVSACVIVLGASPRRYVLPHPTTPLAMIRLVGIHRVYTTSSEGTFAQRQAEFEQIGTEVKALFRRSGVRESLWEDMQRVSPEHVKWLTYRELRDYGLVGDSAALGDHEEAQEAKKLGISKQELLRRKAEADQHCKHRGEFAWLTEILCRNRIMGLDALWEREEAQQAQQLGMSEQEFLRRKAEADQHCKHPPNTPITRESWRKGIDCRITILGIAALRERQKESGTR